MSTVEAATTLWDPVAELAGLQAGLDRAHGRTHEERCAAWGPAIDLVCEGDTVVVRTDVPGAGTGEVSIEVRLPAHVDPCAIRATTRDGVLELRIPLAAPEAAHERVRIPPNAG